VDTDRHVKRARLFVDREEVRIGDLAPQFGRQLECTTGTLVLGPSQLVECGVNVEIGQDRDPAKAPVALGELIGEPAIVALAKRDLRRGTARQIGKKDGRVHDVDVNAEFVHVTQARTDVVEFTGLDSGSGANVVPNATDREVPVDEPMA
jgi:hypothetical protein